MAFLVCPYCRCPVEEPEREAIVCAGCGTPHHSDCYAENGGCTVFGCSAAPEEEPKLSMSVADLATPEFARGVQTQSIPTARPAPPPPVNGAATARQTVSPQYNAGSVLFQPAPVIPNSSAAAPAYVDLTPHPDAKHQHTFVLLGALLGMFGAHSFLRRVSAQGFCTTWHHCCDFGIRHPDDLGLGNHRCIYDSRRQPRSEIQILETGYR